MRSLLISLTCLALLFARSAVAQEGAGTVSATTSGTTSVEAQAARLVEVLEDESARTALIRGLSAIAAGETTAESETSRLSSEALSVPRRIAEESRHIINTLGNVASSTVTALVGIKQLFDEGGEKANRMLDLLRTLGLTVLVTIGVFLVLRAIGAVLRRRIARAARDRSVIVRSMFLLAATLVDGAAAALAWGSGYLFAVSGVAGSVMALSSILFLNAFITIELIKVAMRALFAPPDDALRLLPMSEETARYWSFWVNRLIGLLGYGLMLVVPLISVNFSSAAGHGIGALIALTALVIAGVIVLQNRRAVGESLRRLAARAGTGFEKRIVAGISHTWHVIALIYLLTLFVVWSTRPQGGMAFIASATAQSVAAIVLSAIIVVFISKMVTGGMRLPEELRERLPLLEQRLNAYVPAILGAVRAVVVVAALVAIANAWGLFDVLAWLRDDSGRDLVVRIASAVAIVVVALALNVVVLSWLEMRLNGNDERAPSARARTLLVLFKNAFTIALVVVTGMLVLAELGVNIAPLLAGAGVVGLAVGFGAQKLVQDVITGVFIQLENAMNQGDVVTVAGITGTVEQLTIRSVGLRDLHGVYHLIPFSSADSVSNYMRGFSYYVAEIGVAYRENVDEVKNLMTEAFDRLSDTEHGIGIIGPLEMHGVTTFGDSAVNVRARIKTLPGKQWAIGRAYNEIIKTVFDDHGIEIPFPHVTLYMGEDKRGESPPLRVVSYAGQGGMEDDPNERATVPSTA